MEDLRRVAEDGQPLLRDAALPDWGPIFTAHTEALDRARALELVHLASSVLLLGFEPVEPLELPHDPPI